MNYFEGKKMRLIKYFLIFKSRMQRNNKLKKTLIFEVKQKINEQEIRSCSLTIKKQIH
jgi:hypothetical protein